jgi:hypothetical protein
MPSKCLIAEVPGSDVNRRRLARNKIFPAGLVSVSITCDR